MPVPNTNTFTLQDVCTEMGLAFDGATLSQCFANANAAGFDATYSGAKDRLSNFRNYDHNPTDAYSLGYSSVDGPGACSDYQSSPSTYYLNSTATALNNATHIYTNSAKTTLAPSGWYANAGTWRQWNGTAFPGSAGSCNTGFAPSYYVYLRYHVSSASTLCSGGGTAGWYYLNATSFFSATKIATDSNGFTAAANGYYTDGKGTKLNTSGTLGTYTSCP